MEGKGFETAQVISIPLFDSNIVSRVHIMLFTHQVCDALCVREHAALSASTCATEAGLGARYASWRI